MSETTARPDGPGVSFLIHNEGDHVGGAVEDVAVGDARAAFMDSGREIDVTVWVPIPRGHKVALDDLAAGADVLEYGVRIGRARRRSPVGVGPRPQSAERSVGGESVTQLTGYRRPDGRVGIRNHVVVLPVDDLSNKVCQDIASAIPAG